MTSCRSIIYPWMEEFRDVLEIVCQMKASKFLWIKQWSEFVPTLKRISFRRLIPFHVLLRHKKYHEKSHVKHDKRVIFLYQSYRKWQKLFCKSFRGNSCSESHFHFKSSMKEQAFEMITCHAHPHCPDVYSWLLHVVQRISRQHYMLTSQRREKSEVRGEEESAIRLPKHDFGICYVFPAWKFQVCNSSHKTPLDWT